MESANCEKRQDQIKIQNRQNYEKYHEGQMNQNQFMEAKKQLEEEENARNEELINSERNPDEKNVPVEQMLMYLGYEKLTREMLKNMRRGYMCMMMGEWRWSGNQYKIGVSNRIEVKKDF